MRCQCRLTLSINSGKISSDQLHTTARALWVISKCEIKKRSRPDTRLGCIHLVTNHDQREYHESAREIRHASHPRPERPGPLHTWVMSGVFHNTTGGTSLMCDQMGHRLSENDHRLPQGRKASRKYKWSDSVAQTAEHDRMRPDPSGRKPSRFPNKTPRAGPGPSH